MADLVWASMGELARLVATKAVSPVEIVNAHLDRIAALDGTLKAYITVMTDSARSAARNAEARVMAREDLGPLHGVPVGLKDLYCTKGVKTTGGSRILGDWVPTEDATVVTRLAAAGAITLGKLNMHEFAYGPEGLNVHYGTAWNPWDWAAHRICGGSSSGSGAAVAAGLCPGALGSDTGGSIRIPSALCGLTGLKPTYGRVSRAGVLPLAWSLDHVGPMCRSAVDCALMLGAMAGHDPRDPSTSALPVPDYRAALTGEVKGLRIGLLRRFFLETAGPPQRLAVEQAVKTLEGLGAKVVDVTLPHTGYAVATYYILATSEASSNLARYDGVKYGFRAEGAKDLLDQYMKSRSQGFGPEVKRRIMLGTYALSAGYYEAYYKKGQQVRTLIKRDFDEAFKTVDVIATPTTPTAAFRIGEKSSDPLQMYLSDIFTISVNLAGIPGISIPCGFTKGSLPIGLQLLGRHFDEASVLRTAFAYEQATEWHKKRAKL